MSLLDALLIALAGMAAGGINAMVGSGSLITFPTLLFLGYPPIVANVSNNIGLVPGGLGSIHGYRRELEGQGALLRRVVPASLVGAITGALLLLALPERAFKAIVPALIAIALLLVVAGPRIQRWASTERHGASASRSGAHASGLPSGWRGRALVGGIFIAGVYGGYFGAAQGVLLLGLMSALLADSLQRINAVKNVLGTVVNSVAASVFILVAWDKIDWAVVGLIAGGSLVGGVLGARLGRRLPAAALRAVIVVVGTIAIVTLVT